MTLTIYQLRSGDETRDIRWLGHDELQRKGLKPDFRNYDCVYTGDMYPGETPENIFVRFNTSRPPDFLGHSLSVSDIIVIDRNNRQTAYYVDRIGFKKTKGFRDAETSRPPVRKPSKRKEPER